MESVRGLGSGVVRVIPGVVSVVARPGGGPLAYIGYDTEGNEQAYTLATWDATSAVPLGAIGREGVSLAVTRAGVYWAGDTNQVFYSRYGESSQTPVSGLSPKGRIWPSPSGKLILVESHDKYRLLDMRTGSSRSFRLGRRAGGGIGEAIWTSDTQLFVQENDLGPTEGSGAGTAYALTLSASGRVVSKSVAHGPGTETCPVPSPDGKTWAYSFAPELGGLCLYNHGAHRKVVEWGPRGWKTEDVASTQDELPAWCDSTHVAVVWNEPDGVNSSLLIVNVGPFLSHAK